MHQVAAQLGLRYEREIDPRVRAAAQESEKSSQLELLAWLDRVRACELEIELEREDHQSHHMNLGKFDAQSMLDDGAAVAPPWIRLAVHVSDQRLTLLRGHLAELQRYHAAAMEVYQARRDTADHIETEARRIEHANAWVDEQVWRSRRRRA